MSDLYEQSESDFLNYLSSINRKADNILQQTKGTFPFKDPYWIQFILNCFLDKKEAAIGEAQFEFTEADACVPNLTSLNPLSWNWWSRKSWVSDTTRDFKGSLTWDSTEPIWRR